MASQKSQPPLTPLKENVPPGLLAARRIAYEISSRNRRKEKERRKVAVDAKQSAENEWRNKVAGLLKENPSILPAEKIKTLTAVLTYYLSFAPSDEDASPLLEHIRRLRQELNSRTSWTLYNLANTSQS